MDAGVGKAPNGVDLSPLSAKVFEILARHTAFPWPVLRTQAQRVGVTPEALGPGDLDVLIDALATGVERFTSPNDGQQVRRALTKLASSWRGRRPFATH